MKTNFDTPEDVEMLHKALRRAIMTTDKLYDLFYHPPNGELQPFKDYILASLDLRAKWHEWLGCLDMNKAENQLFRCYFDV